MSDFIPPEFRKYFEALLPEPGKLLPPPRLMLPETVEAKYILESELKALSYHTYTFGNDVDIKAIPATISEWTNFYPPHPTYTIEVYEDLARPAKPFACRNSVMENVFEVHVPKKESDLDEPNGSGALLASWLHEIGHIIGWIFNLPSARSDPRWSMVFPERFDEQDNPIYRSEVEAWSIGEAIYRFSLHRQQCLNSYRDKSNDIFSPQQFIDGKTKT